MRLGEHDLTTIADGQHEDITVLDAEPHEDFNKKLMTNDIAIIYLERHVEFTGELDFLFIQNIEKRFILVE